MSEVKKVVKEKPVKPEIYGPGGSVRKPFIVKHPGVSINGKYWIGKMDLTYDEKANVEAMLSARIQHEIRAQVGDKQAEKLFDLGLLFGGDGSKSEF